MTLYRCNSFDDPRCPFAQGGIVCPHWGKHKPIPSRGGTSCGVWTKCITDDYKEFSVRCCRVKD